MCLLKLLQQEQKKNLIKFNLYFNIPIETFKYLSLHIIFIMDIKFKVNSEVFLYDSSSIVKTIVKKISINENNEFRYVLEGYYHAKSEKDLFLDIDSLLENLKTNVQSPQSLSDKAKGFFKK